MARQLWNRTRHKVAVGAAVIAGVVAAGVVSLQSSGTAATVVSPVSCNPTVGACWKPVVGARWQWQLTNTIDKSVQAPAYDVDGFDTPSSTVASLHSAGRKVVCYISAGSWENWRSDASKFPSSVKGKSNGWSGERWLDIRNWTVLGPIMASRADMCKAKKFDAIEWDNVDGYSNSTGFSLSGSDQIAYNTRLANLAHARGLTVPLKNDVEQVQQLVGAFDWTLNEECHRYSECDTLTPFVSAHKAVWNAEYRSTCPSARAGFSTILKRTSLDARVTFC